MANNNPGSQDGLIKKIGEIVDGNNLVSMNYLLLTGGITSGRKNNNNVVFCLNPTTYIVGSIEDVQDTNQHNREGTVSIGIEDHIFVKNYGRTDAEIIKKPLLTHIILNKGDNYFIPISSKRMCLANL